MSKRFPNTVTRKEIKLPTPQGPATENLKEQRASLGRPTISATDAARAFEDLRGRFPGASRLGKASRSWEQGRFRPTNLNSITVGPNKGYIRELLLDTRKKYTHGFGKPPELLGKGLNAVPISNRLGTMYHPWRLKSGELEGGSIYIAPHLKGKHLYGILAHEMAHASGRREADAGEIEREFTKHYSYLDKSAKGREPRKKKRPKL
jgi:hypothetical protein